MSKKQKIALLVLLVVIIVSIGGYYYWKTKTQKSATDVSVGVLPAIESGAINPMDSVQSANPYDEANPFSKVKTNPFE